MSAPWVDQFVSSLSSSFSGEVLTQARLSAFTSYRIGGPADLLVVPKNREDLLEVSNAFLAAGRPPVFILGNGSNILVSDLGYRGLVIRMTKFDLSLELQEKSSNEPDNENQNLTLKSGASLPISMFLRKCALEGYGGLEFLSGIPGSVGGAVFMNAGTNLGEVESRLLSIEVFKLPEGKVISLARKDLSMDYRKNNTLEELDIVVSATWKVDQAAPSAVEEVISRFLAQRKKSQPVTLPSCGSVFRNPKQMSAWKAIDQCGLRGHTIGGAQFSELHSNFIVNLGSAKAEDVLSLIKLAQEKCRHQLGFDLEPEVKFLGF